jgi:hypothetical protein
VSRLESLAVTVADQLAYCYDRYDVYNVLQLGAIQVSARRHVRRDQTL